MTTPTGNVRRDGYCTGTSRRVHEWGKSNLARCPHCKRYIHMQHGMLRPHKPNAPGEIVRVG